jgi:hypothetical protein
MKIINGKFLGQTYYKFTIGWAIINLPLSLLGWGTFAKVWQPTFNYYHIPFYLVLIGFPIIMAIFGLIIGDLMIKKKVQSEINSLLNQQGNPEFLEVCNDIKAIKAHLGIGDEKK